ncbi:hypothetical protein pb186bvf_006919 [Paramecium bursaria]
MDEEQQRTSFYLIQKFLLQYDLLISVLKGLWQSTSISKRDVVIIQTRYIMR